MAPLVHCSRTPSDAACTPPRRPIVEINARPSTCPVHGSGDGPGGHAVRYSPPGPIKHNGQDP